MKPLSRFTIIPALFFVFLFMGVVPQITANAATGNSPTKQTSTTTKQPTLKNGTVPTIPTVTSDQVTARRRDIQTEKDALQKLQREIKATKKNRDQELAGLQNATVTETTLEQARLAMESTRVNIQSILLDINHVQRQAENLQTALVDLQHQIDSFAGKKQTEHIAALQQRILLIRSQVFCQIQGNVCHMGCLERNRHRRTISPARHLHQGDTAWKQPGSGDNCRRTQTDNTSREHSTNIGRTDND
ncbi:MAG TPA: hypothetical protein ENK33_13475 [Desulfobacterales bacterium]|nr:hypothetical protein [Desulfobacterales bacterium]